MQQIEKDKLRLTDGDYEELARLYPLLDFSFEDDYREETEILNNERFVKIQHLANEKGKIIAFIPDGFGVEGVYYWMGEIDSQVAETHRIIRVEV